MRSRKNIVYVSGTSLCSKKANSLQIANTCCELGRLGNVTLITRDVGMSKKAVLDYYSLDDTFDIVFVHSYGGFGFVRNLSFFLISWIHCFLIFLACFGRVTFYSREPYIIIPLSLLRLLGSRVVLEVHALSFFEVFESEITWGFDSYFKLRTILIEFMAFKMCSHMVVVSSSLRDIISKKYRVDINRISFIVNGFNQGVFNKRVSFRTVANRIVFVGNDIPWKGFDNLVKAFKIVRADSRFADVELLAVGAIKDRGVDGIVYSGHVSPSEVVSFVVGCDIAVIPFSSTFHGAYCSSPLKLFEFMSAGIPIVAPNFGNFRDVLVNHKDCLLFDGVEDMASCIISLLVDAGLRERIGNNAFLKSKSFSYKDRAVRVYSML